MYSAIVNKDLKHLKRLVEEEGANVNEEMRDVILFSPLSMAVNYKWVEGAQYLLNQKANVNRQSSDDWTILQEAAFVGDGKITRLLLEHGADADMIGYKGSTAMSIAANDRTIDALREICRVAKRFDVCNYNLHVPLAKTIYHHDQLAAAILLDAGAKTRDINPTVIWHPWFKELLDKRRNIKASLIVLFACARPLVNKDIAKMLITMAWETRDFDEWNFSSRGGKHKK
ncbi:MAG: ankyrin repeat domain-containing protein [Candidatus Andersenbacteria bacterium]